LFDAISDKTLIIPGRILRVFSGSRMKSKVFYGFLQENGENGDYFLCASKGVWVMGRYYQKFYEKLKRGLV